MKKKAQHRAGFKPMTSRVQAPMACALPLCYNCCPKNDTYRFNKVRNLRVRTSSQWRFGRNVVGSKSAAPSDVIEESFAFELGWNGLKYFGLGSGSGFPKFGFNPRRALEISVKALC